MKKIIILMALILVSLCLLRDAKATTTTLNVYADTQVMSAAPNPNTNFGSDDAFTAAYQGDSRRSYVEFDLSSLGSVTITRANLFLWDTGRYSSVNSNPSVYEVTDETLAAWVEGTMTWNTGQPCGTSWEPSTFTTCNTSEIATNATTNAEQLVEFAVTPAAINAYARSNQILSFMIENYGSPPSAAVTEFWSKEHNSGSKKGYVEITYSGGGGGSPPPVTTIYSPTNTTYTTNPINFTYTANSTTDTVFNLTAIISNSSWSSTLLNQGLYTNGTLITNTTNLGNSTYFFNVSAKDANGIKNSTLFFTVAVPPAAPPSNVTTSNLWCKRITSDESYCIAIGSDPPADVNAPVTNYCYNSTMAFFNYTFAGAAYYQTCNLGCNNATGVCYGSDSSSSNSSMWITFAVGSIFLTLGCFLGMPYGKLSGQENIKGGFDTTIVIKYVFFFVGLFFMYLSLSMSYSNVNLYGGTTNTLGGINTTTLVMAIIVVLFLFVFVIELIFHALKKSFAIKEEKKWGSQETD
jgi:hypothetical protein